MKSLKAKFVINVTGALIGIAIALITVPMYVHRIGEDRYGILSLVWIMLGYLGFMDFGLTRATANALAKMHDAPRKERGSVFMTALWVNVLLGSIGGLIVYFVGGPILLATHNLSDSLRSEIENIMPWVAPLLPLSLVWGVSLGALESRERFLSANIIQITTGALIQVIPLLTAIFISPSLTMVVPATMCVRAVTSFMILMYVLFSEKLSQFNLFDMKRAKSLLSYGVWVSVTNIISPILTSVDQFVIGNAISASNVARYSIPMTAASRLQVFNSSLSRTVFPRFSRLDEKEAAELASRGVVSLAYLSALIFAPALVIVHPFIEIWMGSAFATYAAPVAAILFLGAWINGLAFIPFSLLQGQGRPDLVAKLHTAEILPYIGLLVLLVHEVGITGAAMAWAARVSVDTLVLTKMTKLRVRDMIPAIPALFLIITGFVLGKVLSSLDPAFLLVVAAALGFVTIGIGLLMVPNLRQLAGTLYARAITRAASPSV